MATLLLPRHASSKEMGNHGFRTKLPAMYWQAVEGGSIFRIH